MKRLLIAVAIVGSLTMSHDCLYAQELTKEQKAFIQKQEQDTRQQVLLSQKFTQEYEASLSPEDYVLYEVRKEAIRSFLMPPPPPLLENNVLLRQNSLTTSALSTTTTQTLSSGPPPFPDPSTNPPPTGATNTNTGGGGGMVTSYATSFGACGSVSNVFENVPVFNSITFIPPALSTWMTDSSPLTPPWGLFVNNLDTSGRYAIRSGIVSGGWTSTLRIVMTNEHDTFGYSLSHRIGFYYKFVKGLSGDTFRLTCGILSTNLPASSVWTKATIVVPAVNKLFTTNLVTFTVFKSSTGSGLDPVGSLYAVQWCTEVRPDNPDLRITLIGTNAIVSWDNTAKSTNNWQLAFSPIVTPSSLYSTNLGRPTVVTNDVASVTFAKSTNNMFYKLIQR